MTEQNFGTVLTEMPFAIYFQPKADSVQIAQKYFGFQKLSYRNKHF